MLGISNKSIYGMAAIHQLGLLKEEERLKIKEIAQLANAPQKFLEQILLELKKGGVLGSTKGANGGYTLAKPLQDIRLIEVISILENNTFDEVCKTDNEALKLFWKDKQQALLNVLDTPLSELKAYQERANQNFNYII
ncbi:Rrf2 family transcriptional regulator [bacterium]|nr:Rrf2 family transcriptional regulator [bacterium]MBU1958106.1 Rrf2 family transcriptional regulator [bacterium]